MKIRKILQLTFVDFLKNSWKNMNNTALNVYCVLKSVCGWFIPLLSVLKTLGPKKGRSGLYFISYLESFKDRIWKERESEKERERERIRKRENKMGKIERDKEKEIYQKKWIGERDLNIQITFIPLYTFMIFIQT